MASAKRSSAELYNTLYAALQNGVGEMAKRFLQYRGLPRGSNDTLEALARRVVGRPAAAGPHERAVMPSSRFRHT